MLFPLLTVLAYSDCYTKNTADWVAYLFFIILKAGRSKIKVLADQSPRPGHREWSSHCVLTGVRSKGQGTFQGSFP